MAELAVAVVTGSTFTLVINALVQTVISTCASVVPKLPVSAF